MTKTCDESPQVEDMVTNILAVFDNANAVQTFEGTHWYDNARAFAQHLADTYQVTTDVAACVIAAYSANSRWQDNMVRAESHLAGNPRGLTRSISMAEQAIKRSQINGDVFSAIVGPKLQPFARCVAGDLSAVATDRWAQRAAFNSLDDKSNARWIGRKGVRDDMVKAYVAASAIADICPAVMQAIVWVVVRGSAD